MINQQSGDLFINNKGPYDYLMTVDINYLEIDASSYREPDFAWFEVDSQGHFHTFTTTGDLPTVKTVTVEFHTYWGEERSHTEYRCAICGDPVMPSWRPGVSQTEHIPGTKDTKLIIDNYLFTADHTAIGDKVSFYSSNMFGIASINHMDMCISSRTAKVTLQVLFLEVRGSCGNL